MLYLKMLPTCRGLLVVLVSLLVQAQAPAQSQKQSPSWLPPKIANELVGGDSEQWLQALIDSQESIDSQFYLERLSFFNLTSEQVNRLKAAADQTESEGKRLVLWHAIRQSKDTDSRTYLLEKLIHQSSPETQILFIDGLRNPSRFDVPLLVALYNGHRAKQRQKRNDGVSARPEDEQQRSKGTSQKKSRVGATSEVEPKTSQVGQAPVVERQSNTDEPATETPPTGEIGDIYDVQRKVADLICHTNWESLTTMTGWDLPDPSKNATAYSKWREVSTYRAEQADRAHEEIIQWLIKHGAADSHRVNALRAYLTDGRVNQRRKTIFELVKLLLKDLDDPASKAQAVSLVSRWVEPIRFLDDEAEIVRLNALEAMQNEVLTSYESVVSSAFLDKIAFYKPYLDELQRKDPSVQVQVAARNLRALIDAAESRYAKDSRRPK